MTIDGVEYCGGHTNRDLCFDKSSVQLHFASDDYEDTKDLYTGFDLEFKTSETNQCECLTEKDDASTDAEACVFPFQYQNVTHYQCAGNMLAGEKPFCAIAVNDKGKIQ